MSGGHFEYQQHRINDIIESIQEQIDRSGREKTKEELREWGGYDPEYYEKYPDEKYYHEYPADVINEFKIGVEKLKEAYIYAQRIDWLLSGDDGEESFLERLKEELNKLKNT
jgi:hypothetical protein